MNRLNCQTAGTGQSRNKIMRRLLSAQQERQPVSIYRKHLDVDRIDGFVAAVIDQWVVLQDLVEGVYLDAVVLLRLDLVTKVRRHQDHAYVSRAVEGLGVPLAEFPYPPDAITGDLLRLVDQRADLVCIYLETP